MDRVSVAIIEHQILIPAGAPSVCLTYCHLGLSAPHILLCAQGQVHHISLPLPGLSLPRLVSFPFNSLNNIASLPFVHILSCICWWSNTLQRLFWLFLLPPGKKLPSNVLMSLIPPGGTPHIPSPINPPNTWSPPKPQTHLYTKLCHVAIDIVYWHCYCYFLRYCHCHFYQHCQCGSSLPFYLCLYCHC